jgi:Zn-dependent protease with chaperone function
MSAELPGRALAGVPRGRHADDGSAAIRGSVFTLPASTSFRFALLIAAVAISGEMVYEDLYLAISGRAAALVTLFRACQARALASHPQGLAALASALGQAGACRAGAERVVGLWALLGIGVLGVLAGALYWVQPWWYRRRMHLTPLTSQEAPAVWERLEQLRQRAGAGPVAWLVQPHNFQLSAFAFGRFRRRFVAVSGGAVVAQCRQPAAFDAVVLHELSHIRNHDIDQTYLAVAIWRAFVVAALLPMAGLLIFRQENSPARLLWRVAVLALVVYLLRNSILRAREFDADARAAELDPDTGLGAVLAGFPPRRGRRVWHLGWVHPSGQDRAAALLDPAPLYCCGFWDGLAVGLVAAMGAEAGQSLVHFLLGAKAIGGLVPAFIFALFSGAALAVAVWRMRFWQGDTAAARVWAVGLGLGLGVAIGPFITLSTALSQGVAPDSLHAGPFAILAIWVVLITLLFVSVPAWIGYWADAWQQHDGRVPARAGMAVAAVGTWIALAIGIDLVLAYLTFVTVFTARTRTFLEQTWTFTGYYAARQLGAWVVCLVFIAVPLSGFIAGLRQRPAGGVHSTVPGTRRWFQRARPVAMICLVGAVMVIAVCLVTAAVSRARIAPTVRWNGVYFAGFILNEGQMVILVGVLVALVAAVRLTYAQSAAIALAVGGVVAVLGVLAMMGSYTIGNCVASFSVTYARAPAGNCPRVPGWIAPLLVFPAAVEAMLIGILLIPAAHDAWIAMARRGSLGRVPWLTTRASGWVAAGAAALAVTAGIALLVPAASAHGVRPVGSIGQDGWVHGVGYEFRIYPNWYDLTPARDRGNILVAYDGRFTGVSADLILQTVRVSHGARIHGAGGRVFPAERSARADLRVSRCAGMIL